MRWLNANWLSIVIVIVQVIQLLLVLGIDARVHLIQNKADNSAALDNVSEQVAGVESAVKDVQGTADNIQARTGALVDSMGSVARACTMR